MKGSDGDTRGIGEKLRGERENKGLSVGDVVRETNISRRYITALEQEDFSQFPAETYILGFLRNYGEYLGLDIKKLTAQYRILKIQEQPVPMEQLLNKTPLTVTRIVIVSLITVAGIVLAGGAAYYFLFTPQNGLAESAATLRPSEYSFTEGMLERRFYEGDALIIPLAGNSYKVSLTGIADVVTITAPGKEIRLGLNNEAVADINGDGVAELKVNTVDYAQNRPEMGAQLRFELLIPSASSEQTMYDDGAAGDIPPLDTAAGVAHVIFNEANPYPFTIQAVFSNYCMFRWEIMREAVQQKRTERYYVKGEEQTIRAQNGIRIWLSNSSAVKLWAIGGGHNIPLEIGGTGEVVVEDIYWSHDGDGRYKLIQVRLEN
ncbi:MAG: helix-turn-helix domain-containing protein [Spirochaetaceae bacterium]|jgi:cytoskeletal protein RodZ|nr:helix-turn-helix domain-containing protein [Spirochaetaceae bacterium]